MWYPGKESPAGPKILSEIKYRQYHKYKDDSKNTIDNIVTLPANTTGEWKLPSVFEDLAPSSNEYSSFVLCYGESGDGDTFTTGYYAIPLTLLYKHIDKFWGTDTTVDNTIVVNSYNRNLVLLRKVGDVYKDLYVKAIIALQSNNFGDTAASINPKDGNYFNWLNTTFPTLFNTLRYYTQNFVLPKAAWASLPDYSAGVSKSAQTTYTAEVDGIILGFNYTNGNNKLTINGTSFNYNSGNGSNIYAGSGFCIPVSKGDTYLMEQAFSGSSAFMTFYPLKGIN